MTTDVDGFYSNALLAGDFTGDGVPDIVVTGGSFGGLGSTAALSLLRGIGDGRFASGRGLTLGPLPYDFRGPAVGFSVAFNAVTNLAVGDFDNDGRPEIVSAKGHQPIGFVYNTETIARREFAPDGSIQDPAVASPFLGGDFFYRLTPADFDRDGTFAAAREIAAGVSYGGDPVLTDVNQDGLPDLLAGRGERREYAFVSPNTSDRRAGCRRSDSFTYRACDGELGSNHATVRFEILPANGVPVITSVPVVVAATGATYTYDVQATDPDAGDALTFVLVAGPPGMSIDPDSGVVSWRPACGQTGTFPTTVRVYDTAGEFSEQSFNLLVRRTVTVPDLVGRARVDAETAIVAASLVVGTVTERASATVPAGSVISQSPSPGASVVEGSPVHLVMSTGPPGPGETVVEIVVEPTSAILLVGETRGFTATAVFADGTSADVSTSAAWVSATPAVASIDSLGVASGLAEGTSELQATVDGVTGAATLAVVARVPDDTEAPLAEITSPGSGAEVTAPTPVLGTASDLNFLAFELALAAAGEDDFAVLAIGSAPVVGGVLGELDPTLLLNDQYTLRLTVFDRGGNATVATATVLVDGAMKVGPFSLAFDDMTVPASGLPLGVVRRRYRYSSLDGTAVEIDLDLGVQRVTDPNGNELRIGPNGIAHSAGKAIDLVRDALGRIVSITDPMGRVQHYAYDERGNLARHTDPLGHVTTFSYDRRHNLIRIVDPLGRPVARNEYDASSRLVETTDALGEITTRSYDAVGNLLSRNGSLGEVSYAYNERNQLTSGGGTSYAYDGADNLIAATAGAGVTTYAHDRRADDGACRSVGRRDDLRIRLPRPPAASSRTPAARAILTADELDRGLRRR